MTREEALIRLRIGPGINEDVSEEYNEAVNMAIEALKQQPSEDCISRQAAIEGLASIAKAKAKSDAQKSLMGRVMFFTEHLPSVAPQPNIEHIIKTTIKEYLDKDYDDVTELLLTLNKDLCERIRKEN